MGESGGDNGEITLHLVLQALQGGNIKQKNEGLKHLKDIFDRKHKASNIGVLKDKAYHKIYEVVFKIVVSEKQNFLSAKKSTKTASAAHTRLTACADVVRVVVKAGAPKLKWKTVDAVVDHITQTLPKAEGGYYEPLVHHYLKALSAVFEHPANVEHLKAERWLEVVDFCLQGINEYLDENDGEPSGLSRSFSGLGSSSIAKSVSGNGATQRQSGLMTRQNAEDLLQTLLSLVFAPNAPLSERYRVLAGSIVRFLQLQGSSVGQVHQLAFSILNAVMCFTRTDHLSFTQSIAQDSIPVICRFWQGKTVAKDEMLNSVRDEMLIFLFNVHPHIERGVKHDDSAELLSKLNDLADTMRADYGRRSDRDQLQLDDLEMADFGSETSNTHPFRLHAFGLRPHNVRAERNWAHLQVIGILERAIAIGSQGRNSGTDVDELDFDQHPRKRQRIARSPDRLLDPLNSEDENLRLAGLQVLPFILQDSQLSASELQALLALLHSCASDKRGNIASWALLGISSCTNQNTAGKVDSLDWRQFWHIGTRSLTFSGTCRAAAVELHALLARKLVQYHDIGEDVNSMVTAADTNGPVALLDSSILLMTHLLHARVTEVPGASLLASLHVIRWLFTKWNPDDRFFAAHYAIHVQPHHIITLLRACLGLDRLKLTSRATMPGGLVSQAWQRHLNTEDVIRYLLLLDGTPTAAYEYSCSSCAKYAEVESIIYCLDNAHFHSARKLILELISPKCRGLLQSWKLFNADRSSPISPDAFRSATYSSITMLLSTSYFFGASLPQSNGFETELLELSDALLTFVTDAENRDSKGAQPLVEVVLQAVQPYLPSRGSGEFSQLSKKCPHTLRFFVMLAEYCSRRRLAVTSSLTGADEDLMDLDEEFSTQQSNSRMEAQKAEMPRSDLALEMSSVSFHFVITERLTLLAAMEVTPDLTGFLPSTFVDHLLSLSDEELLSSRPLLGEIFNSDLVVDSGDASRLIRHLGGILSSTEFDRCEVTLGLCLDILVGLGSLWASTDAMDDLAEPASQIYRWFIDVALDKGIASPAVQIGISRLLLLLMEIEPTYGVALSMPSPRSSLFNLLQTSNAAVKFYIGNRLPEVFANFVLKDHDSIFVDILNNLPSQPDWIEGISFRLHVLARLASRWSTLLRRCIYHIFETPGKIRESINHATRCLEDVSSALKVDSPRELFDLFAPQILYTWLESEDIDDIPFQIFGFSSLQDLVIDAQEEAVALMIMRGQDAGVEQLTKILATDEVSLVQKSFSKVIAYTVAHDMSVKSSSNGTKHTTGEARVKHCLGKERLFENYSLHFADIMVVVFNIMDQEVNVEKHFLKKEESMYAAKILKDIKDLSSSGTALPANQQPMFSAKHLTREIEYMCLRTQYEPHSLYSPTMVVFIARRLLNTVHPALGSLHACSVLRKVRILIALAGDAAVAGYPLEMLLQSIRPFLNDQECADDAIGVIQYLLSRGLEHLSQIPSFIAGISLSIVGSLRIFLRSSQSSTTQESQFRTTRSKAGRFRSWFEKYLKTYSSPSLNTEARKNFAKIVESAFGTQSAGNAELGSAQSKLLLLLLQDEKAGESLLSRPSRELALNMLCSEFQIPTSFRQDVLGDDELSIANAVVVWKSCRVDSVSKQYLSWAARVLGRAFASSGQIHQELLQESTLQNINGLSTATEEDGDSRAYVLSILQELTLGHDRHTVGLAEAALRVILSTQDESLFQTCQKNLAAPIHAASTWEPYHLPPSESPNHSTGAESLDDRLSDEAIMRQHWLRDLSIELARSVQDDCLLLSLIPLLRRVSVFAEQVFPFILHLVLSTPSQSTQQIRKKLSNAFVKWLGRGEHVNKNNLKTILNAVLYLRTQPLPNEKSSADRPHWLDIDYSRAAAAAASCGMFKTALLFVEDSCAEPAKTSRRSSMRDSLESSNMHTEMLLTIFQNIDDPDMYYGVQQNAGLRTVLARFEYEKDGPKSLAFRGAQYDSHIRRRDPESSQDVQSLVKALDVLSLSGLSHSLLQSQQNAGVSATSLESMFRTARKLEQWDIPVPQASSNNAVTLYKAYQTVNTAVERATISRTLDEGFECIMSTLVREDLSASALHSSLQTLAALVEMDEVYSSQGSEQYEEMLERFEGRTEWMKIGRFDDISQILSCRGTTLSSLSQHPRLQEVLNIPAMDTRLVEVRTALLASKINRAHNALQESLSSATSMIDLIKPCVEVGLNVEVAIHLEAANALWDQGEMVSSINMLRALDNGANLKNQTIAVGRSDLLSKIGHQVSVARLEKADTILEKYLKPALKELKGKVNGHEAGQVFHQFAVFCDEQLQDPDSLEDLERLRKLSKHKRDEVEGYDKLISTSTSSTDKRDYEQDRRKAKTWLKLDEEELQRHNSSRDEFLRHCLENYLLALSASDDHDSNSLRFSSLWLEHSEDSLANNAVSKHLPEVPSRKLAPLMNQLSSRLQDSNVKFQQLLFSLVLRICSEHPYHGMYQIYAGVKNKPNPKDEAAVSRNRATAKLSKQLQLGGSGQIWVAINVTNDAYCRLAAEKDDRYKSGKRVALKDSIATMRLNETLRKCKIPPPTMQVDIAANLDYSKVPKMHRFESQISIASGVSAPKIITALADNGARFKQLVKGGNDDLRQDAIMEQVFEQVDQLLKTNRSTRQRNLGIRTYKVLPLTSTAGVIEFVPNTMPLHDYLMPAHERYYPKDLKGSQCRKEISEVQNKSLDVRVSKYRAVTDRFHPVMRYFFMEKFNSPDKWFVKRLAYTRSTAAISILGHILGLGDRHGHNILLDAGSGEVVHIDLGVAFETGRVLPVPELVPFRLTRDIVDGMGITKTEGVFRRSCEFTLEALRKEVYSIMTILDVLRYDPLYSWSISPVRLAKLQEEQRAAPEPTGVGKVNERTKEAVNEPGEADRALTVVNKKLSKTLSVTATVNDLINQASDERNLAVLYSGWAAYA